MIIGTNWFLGYSHTTAAKDAFIKENICDRKKMADIIEVFFRSGVDTIMGQIQTPPLRDAIFEAQDRTGVKAIIISIPSFPVNAQTPSKGFDNAEVDRVLDAEAEAGATFCMPHQCTTDAMVDRCTRTIRQMDGLCRKIRERGLIPGLSSHMPEAIVYADESGLDVESYISIFNSIGFLMQIEVDWVARSIRDAKRPVMTIKSA
jgi:hypothetical protein